SYLPVMELVRRYCGIQPDDDERRRREKVTGKVLALDRTLEDTLPHLLSLLGITDAGPSFQQMAPEIRRRRTHEAPARLWLRERRPPARADRRGPALARRGERALPGGLCRRLGARVRSPPHQLPPRASGRVERDAAPAGAPPTARREGARRRAARRERGARRR